MNPAARLVIGILGIVAIGAVATLCAVALRTGEVAVVKDVALLVIGAISGVLAKVGYDKANEPTPSLPLTETTTGTAVAVKEQE